MFTDISYNQQPTLAGGEKCHEIKESFQDHAVINSLVTTTSSPREPCKPNTDMFTITQSLRNM